MKIYQSSKKIQDLNELQEAFEMHSFKIKQFKDINFEKISIGAVLDESMQLYTDNLYLADFKLNHYDLFEKAEKNQNKLLPDIKHQYNKCKVEENIEMYSENCKYGKNIIIKILFH